MFWNIILINPLHCIKRIALHCGEFDSRLRHWKYLIITAQMYFNICYDLEHLIIG